MFSCVTLSDSGTNQRGLEPTWRGVWDGDTPSYLPKDYHTANMDKVIVLLTDGVNEMYDNPPTGPSGGDYTAYGRLSENRIGTTNASQVNGMINTRMQNMCTTIKQQGIIIYTILVQTSDSNTISMFTNCASSPDKFFNATDNAKLSEAFKTISGQLSNLRLAQ
jgi:hypothetical protein